MRCSISGAIYVTISGREYWVSRGGKKNGSILAVPLTHTNEGRRDRFGNPSEDPDTTRAADRSGEGGGGFASLFFSFLFFSHD